MKTPVSYPVYRLDYEAERQIFAYSSGIDGLGSIGRNGEFAHILMEDVHCRTFKLMDEVSAALSQRKRRSRICSG